MPSFTCQTCGSDFELSSSVLERFPNWTPKACMGCKSTSGGSRKRSRGKSSSRGDGGAGEQSAAGLKPPREALGEQEPEPALLKVLETCTAGPQDGLFTDGSASPNPGPGGWGVVWVEDGVVRAQAKGRSPDTTNNRMELQALIEAYRLVAPGQAVRIHSDSDLCVKTITQWAAGWEKRGWRRKAGPIKNLDLVQELHGLASAHPEVELVWLRAHVGARWNEYADALASAGS